MTTKPRFETSPDVEACAEYLRHNKDRGLIEYSAIGRIIKRDVTGKDRYILAGARRILEKQGIVFVVETGKGIRLASASQVAKLSTDVPITKTRRTVKAAQKRQRAVNVQELSEEERAAFYIGRAVLGAIGLAASRAFTNRVTEAQKQSDGPIPIKKTLELFRKVRPRKELVQ